MRQTPQLSCRCVLRNIAGEEISSVDVAGKTTLREVLRDLSPRARAKVWFGRNGRGLILVPGGRIVDEEATCAAILADVQRGGSGMLAPSLTLTPLLPPQTSAPAFAFDAAAAAALPPSPLAVQLEAAKAKARIGILELVVEPKTCRTSPTDSPLDDFAPFFSCISAETPA